MTVSFLMGKYSYKPVNKQVLLRRVLRESTIWKSEFQVVNNGIDVWLKGTITHINVDLWTSALHVMNQLVTRKLTIVFG